MEKRQFVLPITILLASIILGGFIFASQIFKNKSIEQGQRADYLAKQKNNCYDAYLEEEKKPFNVVDFDYFEEVDMCFVYYKSNEPAKTKEQCDLEFRDLSGNELEVEIWKTVWYLNCLNNTFSKEF